MTTEDKLRDYLKRVTVDLRQARKQLGEAAEREHEPIAIVAMGCRFPGGVRSPEDLWQLVDESRDAVGPFPADRGWDTGRLYDHGLADPAAGPLVGGFVHDAPEFDAGFFGIPDREAQAMDPQQRLLLETAWELVERSGIAADTLRGTRTGVFIGTSSAGLATAADPPSSDQVGYLLTGGTTSVASGRIAFTLGLEGPALTIDTACSSSLVALHTAGQSLRQGECSLAVAGGVTIMATPAIYAEFGKQGGLAADGRCKPFAAAADGTGWGEGAGLVLLERLSDARRHGHRVLALIRGSAVNSDGASNGLTAPNGLAQQRVIRQALAAARLAPGEIDAVEAHGTGTALGDPIEAQALLAAYGQDRLDGRPLLLGSVKSNLGHTQAAAGIAGVIKMVAAMHHGRLPRTLHIDRPTPQADWTTGAVSLLTEPVDWPRTGRPRRAGVSSFGISGTNAHVILEQAPAADTEQDTPAEQNTPAAVPVPPLLLSAKDESALRDQARLLSGFLTEHPGTEPAEVAYALATTRSAFEHRAAVPAGTRDDILRGLAAVASGAAGVRARTGRTALVFPGQGAQLAGMGSELYSTFPAFATAFDEVCAQLDPLTARPVREVAFAAAGTPRAALLDRTGFTQPALFAVEVALFRLVESWGVTADYLIGHSVGELAAAHVAGVLSLRDACVLVAARGRLMEALPGGGAMLAVQAPEAEVAGMLAGRAHEVGLAAVNGPHAVVLSGAAPPLEEIAAELTGRGINHRRLAVSHAFHSPLMEPMLAEFAEVAATLDPRPPATALVSTLTGRVVTDEMCEPDHWVRHARQAVRFADGVRTLMAAGVTRFFELGPSGVAAAMIEDCTDEWKTDAAVVAALRPDRPGTQTLPDALAGLHTHGGTVDWPRYFGAPRTTRLDLPTYPFQRRRFWPRAPRAAAGTAAPGLDTAGHPWLTAQTALADGTAKLLLGRLSLAEQPWLADHRVHGAVVLPGTGLLELAMTAARRFGAGGVRELSLITALVLPETTPLQIQVITGTETVSVHSRPEGDETWTLHATGELATTSPGPGTGTEFEELRTWPVPGTEPVGMDGFYERAREQGLDYGPAFRRTAELHRRDGLAYGRVRLPQDTPGTPFALHPALLDAALNVVRAVTEESAEPLLPVTWSDTELYATGATELRVRIESVPAGDDRRLTLWLADADGEPVARIGGLRLRRVGAAQLRPAVQDLYRIDHIPAPADSPTARTTVVLAGDGTVADALGARRAPGLDTLMSSPATEEAPERVVVDATAGGDIPDLAVRTLELLRRGLAEPKLADTEWVWVTGDDPAGASLRGLLRVAANEYADREIRLVELAERPGPALARALAATGEPETVVRGGDVLTPRLVRAAAHTEERLPRLGPEGTALITGGTGELGSLIARHLVRAHGVRRLVLTSRRGPDAPGAAQLVHELTDAGALSVRVAACDVADRAELTTLLSTVDPAHPLTAVLHLAGVLDDGLVPGQTGDRLARVFAPKAGGALLLDELTRERPPAAFVLFSSAAGVLGTAGQSTYAAANTTLDAIAVRRRAAGLPAVSLAWGLWQQAGTGMTAHLGPAELARMRRQGVGVIPAADGLRLLDAALRHNEPNLVPIRLDLAAARQEADRGEPVAAILRGLVPPPLRRAANAAPAAPTALRARLSALPADERAGTMTGVVLEEIAAVLGLPSAAVLEPDQALREAGLDSLMAVELRRRLSAAMGVALPSTTVFDYPTPTAIAGLLLTRMDLAEPRTSPASQDQDPDPERSVEDINAELDALLEAATGIS
ncbi:SDR family NAD(P)-dependent oxidoreductase [Streptomyces sp. NPDC059896]|uniref:SDR family NAD(P)-dependent oxidoreductase n=1 Tax=Streptomyces sp. NPDC059896 TaxID=3346993 RepID=UPI00365646AD